MARPPNSPRSEKPGPQLSVFPNPRVVWRAALETDTYLVADKPAGVATQPGIKHQRDTLLNGVFSVHGKRLQNLGKARDYGLVHRLDRPTSGLVIVAKTADAYDSLRGQFAAREVDKTYLTLVRGAPRAASGRIEAPISEVRGGGRKRARIGEGPRAKPAVTEYTVLARGSGLTLLACKPKTGRLHQIRAHCAWLRMPVVGDFDYGRKDALDKLFARATKKAIFLHAGQLTFTDPETGRRVTAHAPLPARLRDYLESKAIACPKSWR